MGKEINAWKAAQTQAAKLVGKDGKIPKPKADVTAAMEASNNAALKLISERDALEGTVLELKDALAKVGDAAESYSNIIEGSDFDMDDDDKDQKKKIAQIQKLLMDPLADIKSMTAKFGTNLDTFNKQLANLEKDLKAATT